MFGSQQRAVVDKTWGNMQAPQVLPSKGGQKGGAQANLMSGGFVLVIPGLGAGKKKTKNKLETVGMQFLR